MKIERQIEIVKELLKSMEEVCEEYNCPDNREYVLNGKELLKHLEDRKVFKGFVIYCMSMDLSNRMYLTKDEPNEKHWSHEIEDAIVYKKYPYTNACDYRLTVYVEELK